MEFILAKERQEADRKRIRFPSFDQSGYAFSTLSMLRTSTALLTEFFRCAGLFAAMMNTSIAAKAYFMAVSNRIWDG